MTSWPIQYAFRYVTLTHPGTYSVVPHVPGGLAVAALTEEAEFVAVAAGDKKALGLKDYFDVLFKTPALLSIDIQADVKQTKNR